MKPGAAALIADRRQDSIDGLAASGAKPIADVTTHDTTGRKEQVEQVVRNCFKTLRE